MTTLGPTVPRGAGLAVSGPCSGEASWVVVMRCRGRALLPWRRARPPNYQLVTGNLAKEGGPLGVQGSCRGWVGGEIWASMDGTSGGMAFLSSRVQWASWAEMAALSWPTPLGGRGEGGIDGPSLVYVAICVSVALC